MHTARAATSGARGRCTHAIDVALRRRDQDQLPLPTGAGGGAGAGVGVTGAPVRHTPENRTGIVGRDG